MTARILATDAHSWIGGELVRWLAAFGETQSHRGIIPWVPCCHLAMYLGVEFGKLLGSTILTAPRAIAAFNYGVVDDEIPICVSMGLSRTEECV